MAFNDSLWTKRSPMWERSGAASKELHGSILDPLTEPGACSMAKTDTTMRTWHVLGRILCESV